LFVPSLIDSFIDPHLYIQRQRTVYRLTLVKAWNVEEMQAYSELIALGQPDFIEVKVRLGNISGILFYFLVYTSLNQHQLLGWFKWSQVLDG